MKSWRLLLIWFFVLAELHASISSSIEETFSEMSELMELCPYTSFCNQNASTPFPYSEDYEPCCQSCSCDPDCGLHGNCCFSQLDKFYTESAKNVVCRSGFVVQPSEEELPDVYLHRYRMIDTCRNNDSESDMKGTSCQFLSSDTIESFHPVVSRYTGFIYTNTLCALCNNVSDAVPWRRVITCSPNAEASLSESLEKFMSGNQSAVISGCYIYYTPPSDFDLSPAESCNPLVKRTCDTELFNETSRYRRFCEMFNATFAVRMGRAVYSYANVYCLLCKSESLKVRSEIRGKQCLKFDHLYNYRTGVRNRLTVLLDMSSHDQNQVSNLHEVKSDCSLNSVSMELYKNECRRIRCPWGQILLNNGCGYYSNMWTGGPFSVMLRLLPVKRNKLIPSSFFNDMPEYHKNDRQAPWLNRKTLIRWKLLVLYHQYQDKPAVEYIVVKATYPSMSVNPQHLQMMLKVALDDTWQIHYNNSSYDLRVNFNEYSRYDVLINEIVMELGVNTTEKFVYYPATLFCLGTYPGQNYFEYFLYPISTFTLDEINAGIQITKLFFCDQVDLLPEEYDYKCGTIFFRVKNTTIHTFSIVKSTTSEFSGPSVRVCLHEFDHTHNSGLVTSFHSVMFVTILIFSDVFLA